MMRSGLGVTILLSLALGIVLFAFMTSEEVVFDSITGQVFATVQVQNGTFSSCSVDLPAGQSLFSAYCIGAYENPAILANVSGFSYALFYDPTQGTDPWKVYTHGLPDWVVNDLQYLSRLNSYVVGMSGPGTFSFSGIIKDSEDVPVYGGYNLMGYPLYVVQEVNQSLSSVYGDYSHVVGYNATLGEYVNFTSGGTNNTLFYLVPMQGYWINMSADDIISFVT